MRGSSISNKKSGQARETKKTSKVKKPVQPNTLVSAKRLVKLVFGEIFRFIKSQRDAYPVIVFSLLPVLTFWSGSNIQELTLSLMTRTLVVCVMIGLFIYGVYYLILGHNKYKASILAIITIFTTFSYGTIYRNYEKITSYAFGDKSTISSKNSFLWILIIVLIVLGILIKKKLKLSKTVRNYLALFATVLLIFNTYPLIKHWVENRGLRDLSFGSPVQAKPDRTPKQTPDIYYLIFDRYANQSVLKNTYGFDNSPFLNSLKEKDFYVASDSTANYPYTGFSLASSLNLDYLPQSFQDSSKNGVYNSLLHDKIEDNQVVPFLKKQGYSFTNIGPWWGATKYSKHADQNLYNSEGIVLFNKKIDLQEHEHLLFQNTIFYRFSRKPLKIGNTVLYGRTYPDDDSAGRAVHRQTMLHQFDQLKQMAHKPGPKYVFAHFLMPHNPYVVDENCKHTRSKEHEYVLYIKQLRCTNTKIQETVDYILKNSSSDPIIVIQADEGPYPVEFTRNKNLQWSKVSLEILHQKANILNTYHFPDKNYSKLYPNISPVNTFRVIFNQYFGTELPLLKDRHYFSESREKKFHLFEVTDKFRN